MPLPQDRFRVFNPAAPAPLEYLRIRERTWAELIALDPAAEVGRVYAIYDWGRRNFFYAGNNYWRPLNGCCVLFDGGDMSSLTYSSTSSGALPGLVSPEFPFRDLLKVPGCRLRTVGRLTRSSPSSSQTAVFEPFAGGVLRLGRRNITSTDEVLLLSGETMYTSTPYSHRSATGEIAIFANAGTTPFAGRYPEVVMPDTSAGRKLSINLQTGGAGETMTMRDFRVEYHA